MKQESKIYVYEVINIQKQHYSVVGHSVTKPDDRKQQEDIKWYGHPMRIVTLDHLAR